MLELYANIRKRRNELEMTQSELAAKVGYSDKSMVAKVENGKVDLPQSKILEFARALQTTPSELMGWNEKVSNWMEYHGIEYDTDTQEYLQELRDRSEMKMLFKSAKTASKEQIEAIVHLLDSMKGK